MKKLSLLIFTGFFAFSFLLVPQIFSDEYDELSAQIQNLNKALELSRAATAPHERQLKSMQDQIDSIKIRVSSIESDIAIKRENINEGYKNLQEKKKIFDLTVAHQYVESYYDNWFTYLLSSSLATDFIQNIAYQKAKANQDKIIITNTALSISNLEAKKRNLENEQRRLTAIKTDLDIKSAELDKLVSGAKAYQSTLSSQIAALSARQQEIVTARSGTFTASIGDSELADDYNASIKGFRETAPGGYFAVFAFGAHTHRKGMSQYGARGRAQQGQDYKAILKAYYGKEPVNKDTGGDINVSGFGSMNFEERYLYGIAEMPSSWNEQALKAQAVAARTYAYRYKQNGQSICTTEACQVFSSSKADTVAADTNHAWHKAVADTHGQVLEDVVTYYASTHGGFASPIGWDTTDGSGGGNFIDKSYDKLGGSPWLYKAWYTKGYSPSSDKCGRSNPYLSPEELADIINAARYRDDRVTPVTTSCWGGNPYSHEELRAKSNGPSSVSGVSVSQGNGSTNEVIFQTNIGEIRLSGSEFKTAFNVRAPGYLSIPQSGFAFYNIERK